jgi:hypothetical protein
MRVGYAGRPPSSRSQGGRWSPADRLHRYALAVASSGLECVEIPANLLLGKGDWRNQLLTECTEPRRLRAGRGDVQVLMRLSDQHLAEPANVSYARQLAALYGASSVTMAFRPSREPKFDRVAQADDEGGVPLALVTDWYHLGAITASMEIARGNPGWTIAPSISLGKEHGQNLSSTVRRALATCQEFNRSKAVCVFVACRPAAGSDKPFSADIYTVVKAICAHENQSGAAVSLLFSGPAAATLASEAAAMRASVTGEPFPRDARRGVPQVGSRVKIRDVELGADLEYSIVPPENASVPHGRLSSESPVARAILGQPCGACVEVSAPGGRILYELLEVNN